MLKHCWIVLSFLASVGRAAKDNDYYFPGYVNPNTKDPMYWKDSINVLQDLDQFEALYIKYHGCVWSRYGRTYGSGQNYDEQGAEQDDDNFDNGNGCGGWGGEYFWYMGRTQCFRANVAYSLYGILKSNPQSENKQGSYCHAGTYINSFFTTYGTEGFAGPLGLGIDEGNSYCQSYQSGGNGGGGSGGSGDNNADDMYANLYGADDDYLDDGFQYRDFHSYSSQGTGCSAQGKFVTDQYEGAFCSGSRYVETLDTLDSFNEALESLECTQIYDGSGDRRGLEDNDDDQYYDFEAMDAVKILSFSKSCSKRQYPNDCPDPYGKKKKYARKMVKGLQYKTGNYRDIIPNTMKVLSCLFLLLGIVFANAAFLMNRGLSLKKLRQKKQIDAETTDAASPRGKYEVDVTPPATPPTPPATPPPDTPSTPPRAAGTDSAPATKSRSYAAAELIVETPLVPKNLDHLNDAFEDEPSKDQSEDQSKQSSQEQQPYDEAQPSSQSSSPKRVGSFRLPGSPSRSFKGSPNRPSSSRRSSGGLGKFFGKSTK